MNKNIIFSVLAIGYLIAFYCFLTPTENTALLWNFACIWLSFTLIPTAWIKKYIAAAMFLWIPLAVTFSILAVILYGMKYNFQNTLYIGLFSAYVLGYKYNPSSPWKVWRSQDIENEALPNWLVWPVLLVMGIIFALVVLLVIIMLIYGSK